MAAVWVHAICMTRAHSTSSRGFAPSINAKLAFTAISEIPLHGRRAAAISCVRDALTKALEAVPNERFSARHHSPGTPSGGYGLACSELIRYSLTLTGSDTFLTVATELAACLGCLLMAPRPFSQMPKLTTEPAALLSRFGCPSPVLVVPVAHAFRRPWAQPTVQATPFPASEGTK